MPAPTGGMPTGTEFLGLVSKQIGTPYVWGGDQPGGFDCSGLVKWAADQLGLMNFPRTSEGQWGAVQRIRADQLQPGDLIFMNFPGEVSPGHVVIYAGGDQIIQAPSTGQLVQRDSFHSGTAQAWGAQIVGYGRIPGLSYAGEPVTTNLGSGGTTSGGAGSGGGAWQDLFGVLQHAADQALAGIFPGGATSLSEAEAKFALGGGASGLGAVAVALAGIEKGLAAIAQPIDWLLHPNHWIRIFAGLAGTILVGMGIWQMSHAGGG